MTDLDEVIPALYAGTHAIRRASWPESWQIIRVNTHQFIGPNGSGGPTHRDIVANDWELRSIQ